jgi:large subunit ribosomal protein L30
MPMSKQSNHPAARPLKVTLVRSVHGQLHRHKATVRGLGLRRMHQTVTVVGTPEIRGMLDASRHLLRVEEA